MSLRIVVMFRIEEGGRRRALIAGEAQILESEVRPRQSQ